MHRVQPDAGNGLGWASSASKQQWCRLVVPHFTLPITIRFGSAPRSGPILDAGIVGLAVVEPAPSTHALIADLPARDT
jgi:hypothetical protein